MGQANNIMILIGNLGDNPEMKYTESGKAVLNFSLGVKGFKKDETDWHDITCWGKLAETMGEYLKKGMLISVVGSSKFKTWVDKDSQQNRKKHYVLVDNIQMLGSKKQEESEDIY